MSADLAPVGARDVRAPKGLHQIYGLVAEFDAPGPLVEAAKRAREAGYRRMDAFSPYPVEHLHEALGFPPTKLSLLVFCGALAGAAAGFGLQYYASVIDYPVNIGGRPLNSWPVFLPITVVFTVLGAALVAVLGMLALNGLPMPHHPIFNAEHFALATRDRFFLCVEAADPKFDRAATRAFLEGLGTKGVTEVES